MHRGLRAQPVFRAAFDSTDLGDVIATFERLLHEAPRTRAEISREVASRWPGLDAPALSSAMAFLPLVQVTPRGLWRTSGGSAFALLEDWLGERVERGVERPPDDVLLRYLAAFGPSTVADAQSWSGLRSLGAAFERLRPRLRTFEDARGRELLDVPRAALPGADVTAPVRFLAEYDNVLLAHKDRSRIVRDGVRQWTAVGWGSVLVDGWVSGRWRPLEDAVLRVEPFRRLSATERREVGGEARRLAAFLAPDAARVRVDLARSPG
jgi:hypothetical protein